MLPFGRYFAGHVDLLTRDGFKSIVPIDGVSPFSGVGESDPEMQHFADADRANSRVKIDVRKDLAAQLAQADAEFLVVDNSTALLLHREVNGRLYTVIGGEPTELTDTLWNTDPAEGRALAVKLSHQGLTDSLRSIYDLFVQACLASFDSRKIILVRSHGARFWVAEDGTIAPTNVDRRDAKFLDALDDYFIAQTGCQVADSTLGYFPPAASWQSSDHRLRQVMENELVELFTSDPARETPDGEPVTPASRLAPELGAADHVVGAFRRSRPVDQDWLKKYFAAGGASFDDLLALAYLEQSDPGGDKEWIRSCVRDAVADPHSHPVAVTRRRFESSVRALRQWPHGPLWNSPWWRPTELSWPWQRSGSLRDWWRAVWVSPSRMWTPQIAAPCGSVVLRFLMDGSLVRVPVSQVAVSEAGAVVEGRLPVTPLNLLDVLGSWAVYLERARRAITTAPRVVVADVDELIDTCAWIDWATVLESERVAITAADSTRAVAPGLKAKTDLSFIFDPNTRIGTVGGGLMDQVTHIGLFDDLCRPHGFDLYIDDLRYTWWRSHNGFEASRLAPELDAKRITRLVSPALIESFRAEVMRTRLPWVYNQSRVWFELGLAEATVVTKDHPNSRRLMESSPEFPVLVYTDNAELGPLIEHPPTPVCFYTTQQRILVAPESAAALRRVFSYEHLAASGLDPDVRQTAELLRSVPHVAFHVRRGDYMQSHFDTGGWHARQDHYIAAINYLIDTELGTTDFNVAVFSDDLAFVEEHLSDYGLDRVAGQVRFIRGHTHFKSIYDSYLISLCPIVVGSVGSFAATTTLLADPPAVFIRARPGSVKVEWRR